MARKIKILVVGSFLLNILLIGIVIGNLSHRLFHDDFRPPHPPEGAMNLSPEKEKMVSEAMERVRLENRDIHKKIKETKDRIVSIMKEREFDTAAYERETAELHKLMDLMMQRFADATKELAKGMNQKERQVLAEFLRRPPPPPYKGDHHFRPGPPP